MSLCNLIYILVSYLLICFWQIKSYLLHFDCLMEFLKVPFLVLHFSYYTLMTFLISWWCYLWYCYLCWWYYSLESEKASELESDLWDTVNWGRKWFVDFNAGKTKLVLFERSTLVLLMWKWMDPFLRKNHFLRCWVDLLF